MLAVAPDPRRFVEREIIAATFRNAWPSLPALTIASAAVCLAAVVPIVVVPGINPLAALLAAVCIAPFGAALVAVVQQMAAGDHGTLTTWGRSLRRHWRFAIGHALVAAVPLAAFLAALHVLDRTGAPWVWPSVALSGAVAVLTALGLTAVIPLGLADPCLASRGPTLWLAALALVAARPVRFSAVVAAAGFVVWLGTAVSASLLLFVPAPAAIVAVTATWTAAAATDPIADASASTDPSGES
ncbi:hypothetical protein [Desertimonas flava]|uniref:hypothetical protein n=1 Tax=Desertimonas flava TaxID=2064846 RepID=UPI00187824F2|nr:hypothetical protein [Desertimonas flava]